jgi:hypothetical protein
MGLLFSKTNQRQVDDESAHDAAIQRALSSIVWKDDTKNRHESSLLSKLTHEGCEYSIGDIIRDIIRYRQCENEIIEFIEEVPDRAKSIDSIGRYPLHYACRFSKSIPFITKLYDLHRPAIQSHDARRSYPLHLALIHHRCDSLIFKLVDEYPQAVKEKDSRGRYPLHLALMHHRSKMVVLKLVDEFPQAARVKEKESPHRYPLQMACLHNQCEYIVLTLINLCPVAVKENCSETGYPLSVAKRNRHPATVIQVLEELFKKSNEDLENRVGIPKIVALHGLGNRRRFNTIQWILCHSPPQN